MYNLFPTYGSFAFFIIAITLVGILSLFFKEQLNAIEDSIRDSLEIKLKAKKQQKRTTRQVSVQKIKNLPAAKNNGIAA